jgi:hypothetical protein
MTTGDGPQPVLAPAPAGQAPGPDDAVIPLPPVPTPAAPAEAARRSRVGWRHVLGFLVLVLAFLSASFLARNSDLWFHLATGRLLAQRQFTFGVDPFAYTTEQVYWACHSWLFDLALYEFHGLVGGTGLVILKALLVTALAGLLLQVRRPAGAAWVPAVCTTLAVLAMSPRLLLQPACASYVLLGVTFWLLWSQHARQEQGAGSKEESGKFSYRPPPSSVLLLLVFVVWVNLDEWFLLGPLLVALFWLGERLGGQRRTPGWLVPAGLAACLLNPHGYHAFTLPADLSPVVWSSGLSQDVRFQALFASAWQEEYLRAAWRLNMAALAYFALTLLGVTSFLLHRPALRDWRLVVWLPFALLAAWQVRAIPFFAVVAAPVTALNWQDRLAAPQPTRASWLRHPACFVLSLALLGLMFLTWVGWPARAGREGRHVAWGVEEEPSLRRAAETLHEWRRQKLLPEGVRVFAASPEAAHYAAWFAPGERQFLDHRYQLFGGAARDYEAVCRALLPDLVPARGTDGERGGDWRAVLRGHGAGVVLFYDRDPQRLFAVLRRLANDPEHWTPLCLAGQALIAGWNEAGPPGGFSPLAFDADRLAFGPQDERARWALPAAPERGPEKWPARRDLWARLARPPAPPSWESAAATTYLHYADDSEAGQRQRQLQAALGGYAASLTGVLALPDALPQAAFQLAASRDLLFPPRDTTTFLVRDQLGPFFARVVDRPPALELLAVRAARRAVAANPEDANAWLRLGHAYLLLRNVTCEHSSRGQLPPLAQLRHVQIVTVLEQAVRLDPDLEAAHSELAYLYGERNFLDQSLEHRRQEVRLTRRSGRQPGETDEQYVTRLEVLDKDTAKLADEVQARRKAYDAAAASFQGDRVAKARAALRLGLARVAADEVLLPSPADLLGAPGIKLELELLLSLGRTQDVRLILGDRGVAGKHQLGYHDLPPPRTADGGFVYPFPYRWPTYEWLHALATAAAGDYGQAREGLREIRARVRADQDQPRQERRGLERDAPLLVSGLLSEPPPFLPAFRAQVLGRLLDKRARAEAGERTLRAHEADLGVLEALLALEQGDTEAARSAFAEAQELCAPAAGPAIPFAGRPIAAAYLEKLSAK